MIDMSKRNAFSGYTPQQIEEIRQRISILRVKWLSVVDARLAKGQSSHSEIKATTAVSKLAKD